MLSTTVGKYLRLNVNSNCKCSWFSVLENGRAVAAESLMSCLQNPSKSLYNCMYGYLS